MFERLKNALGAGSTKLELDGLTQWVTEHMLAYRAPGSGPGPWGQGVCWKVTCWIDRATVPPYAMHGMFLNTSAPARCTCLRS